MTIKILKIREFINAKSEKIKYRKTIGIDAPSVAVLFKDIDKYIEQIPEHERFNLHYTVAHWGDDKGKDFVSQSILPFDLDDIDVDRIPKYIDVVCKVLDVDPNKVGTVSSGNGLHIIVELKNPITDSEFFKNSRHYYKALGGRLKQALYLEGLYAEIDAMSWQTGKSLRLPNTENRKEAKGIKQCVLLNGNIEPYDLDLVELSGLPTVEMDQQINPSMLKVMNVDTKGVLSCPFIQYCGANPADVNEPQWYASLSLLGRLPHGKELAHTFSKGHPSYNEDETDLKLEQATECSGPRTCANISSMWEGCAACSHRNVITSPIQLQSEEFIKTKGTGFYNINYKDGNPTKSTPNYDDLMKHFHSLNPFVTIDGARSVMAYDGGIWEQYGKTRLHCFSEEWFDPKPNSKMCDEFMNKLLRNNIEAPTFFETVGKVNFENGWINMHDESKGLQAHTQQVGFLYKLPFKYDATAKCPRFTKFLNEVTCGDASTAAVLVEFMGYTFAGGDPNVGSKALIMVGCGSNGKSILVEVIRSVVGDGNYSATNLMDAIRKPEARANMQGKLLNISEETPNRALMDSSTFKNLVTGGLVEYRRLYDNAVVMKNIAKLIMTCNELPYSNDITYGMRRRLLIVPFNAVFTDEKGNRDPYIIEKLQKELPGIFNLCFDSYKEFAKRGHFSSSDEVDSQTEQYVNESSSVVGWLRTDSDYTITNTPGAKTKVSEVYKDYQVYCLEGGEKPLSLIVVNRELGKIGIKKQRIAENGTREFYYLRVGKQGASNNGQTGDAF